MADINLGVGGANSASSSYEIDNSVKLESNNTEFFIKNTMSSTGNRRTWTFSGWVKRTELCSSGGAQTIYAANVDGNEGVLIRFSTENASYYDAIQIDIGAGGTNSRSYTTALFRDVSAWYHIVLACDTTQSTATDRFKLYVNGVLITDYASRNNPAQNFDTSNNLSGAYQQLGAFESGGGQYARFNGYMAECYNIDGQALAPTAFGEFDAVSGIWKPKEYTGTFGTNGFYLNFSNAASMGADSSGQGNSLPPQNINQNDQATDTPTNNFCTLNPNFIAYYYKAPTDGGTYMPMDGINQYGAYAGTFGLTKGKWYYETYVDMRDSTYGLTVLVGIHTLEGNYHANNFMVDNTNQNSTAAYYLHGGHYYSWDSGARVVDSTLGGVGSAQVGQFIGIALNLDDNQISFYINGSAVTNGTNLALNDAGDDIAAGSFAIPSFSSYTNNHTVNFGGYTRATISSAQSDANGYGTFEHQPPSGYYAICSKNLAEYG